MLHIDSDRVDLRSDTITQPTPGMRKAMASATVGDDVLGDDPTVIELQNRLASIFNKDRHYLSHQALCPMQSLSRLRLTPETRS